MKFANIKNNLTLLLSILITQFFYAQDLNQKVAIKEFKANTYKNWKVAGGYSTKEDGTRDISYKYDDDGNVNVILLGKAEYELDYVKDSYGNKLYTGTHFRNKGGSFNIVYMSGKLYVFKMMADGSFGSVHSVIAKKGGSVEKADKQLESYAVKIQEIKKQKEIELKAVAKKNNPESFYAEVGKEYEGFKRVKNKQGKYGFINSENELVIPCKYDDAYEAFNSGIIGIILNDNYGYIDSKENVIIKIDKKYVGIIRNNLILVEESNGVYNLYDLNGKVKQGPFANAYWDKNQLTYYVKKENDHGFLQKDNSIDWVLKNRDFDTFSVSGDFYVVGKNNKKGLIDAKTKQDILKPTLDVIYGATEGVFVVENDKKFGLYKPKTGFITEVIYNDAYSFKNGKAAIIANGLEGSADLNGNITWGDGSKTSGVALKTPLSSWRNGYSSSGVLVNSQLTPVGKGSLKGFVDDKGVLKIPLKYSSTSNFVDGRATVTESGKTFQINELGEKVEYKSGVGNSIEMSFSYATLNSKSFHFGIIWDKKTGDNRIFYSRDIYQYDFKGKSNWTLPKADLLSIMDAHGDIMMKAQAFYEQKKDGKEGTEVFVWNTHTGKYLKFYYNKGFVLYDKNLEVSKYASTSGGRVMYDYEVDYAQGIAGYDPVKSYLVWNTYTGENNKVTKGKNPFSDFNAAADGEVMMDLDLGVEGGYDSRGGWITAYTTKSLKMAGYSKYSGENGYGGYSKPGSKQTYKKKSGETDFDFHVAMGSLYKYKSGANKTPQMLIFNKKAKTNNVGTGLGWFKPFNSISLPDYKYTGVATGSNEMGMLQITNEQKSKLEYWFWDKTTGEFTICLFSKNKTGGEFVTPITVYSNLLTLEPGTAAHIGGGELSAAQLESGTTPKASTASNGNNTSSSKSTSNYYYIENTTNKEIKISINGGLSNHVNSGSKLKVECGKPASIMYLDGSSWKIGNQISSGKGVCGETVKY